MHDIAHATRHVHYVPTTALRQTLDESIQKIYYIILYTYITI